MVATASPRTQFLVSDRVIRVATQATAWTGQLIDLRGRTTASITGI